MDWDTEIDNIKRMLLEEKRSYEEIGRIYGYTGSWIRKLLKKRGVQIPARRKKNPNETFNKGNVSMAICLNCNARFAKMPKSPQIFCSLKCYNEYKKNNNYAYYLEHQEEWNGQINMHWIKEPIMREQENKCAICGHENIWNGQPLLFILDHIDGRCSNNYRNNLRLICPNCDSQLETYKRRNKISDRAHIRRKYASKNSSNEHIQDNTNQV